MHAQKECVDVSVLPTEPHDGRNKRERKSTQHKVSCNLTEAERERENIRKYVICSCTHCHYIDILMYDFCEAQRQRRPRKQQQHLCTQILCTV